MEKNRYFYAEIRKGVYGLPQDGRIANVLLANISCHMATTIFAIHQA